MKKLMMEVVMLLVLCGVVLGSNTWHWNGSVSDDFSDPNNWDEGTIPADGNDIVNDVENPMKVYDWLYGTFGSITVSNPDQLTQSPSINVDRFARIKCNVLTIGGPNDLAGGASFYVDNAGLIVASEMNLDEYGLGSCQGWMYIGDLGIVQTGGQFQVYGGTILCNALTDSYNKVYVSYGRFYVLHSGWDKFYNPMDWDTNEEVDLVDYSVFAANWLDGIEPMEMMMGGGGESMEMSVPDPVEEVVSSEPIEKELNVEAIQEIIDFLQNILKEENQISN